MVANGRSALVTCRLSKDVDGVSVDFGGVPRISLLNCVYDNDLLVLAMSLDFSAWCRWQPEFRSRDQRSSKIASEHSGVVKVRLWLAFRRGQSERCPCSRT